MIPNIHQSIEEIIKNASPEQKILWQQVRLISGENAAVQQFYFEGTNLNAPFNTYVAGQIWLALKVEYSYNTFSSGIFNVVFFDQDNVQTFAATNNSMAWNTTAAAFNFFANTIKRKNVFFGRAAASLSPCYTSFIGYKIVY